MDHLSRMVEIEDLACSVVRFFDVVEENAHNVLNEEFSLVPVLGVLGEEI